MKTELTKLEQACITLGVPETGNAKLDYIISKSMRDNIAKEVAGYILQSQYDAAIAGVDGYVGYDELAKRSVKYADEMLKELYK